jgi:hypothetical protein
MTDDKAPTHTAYARKRIGRRYIEWLEIGKGRLDENGVFHGLLKTTPIGGFDGYVYFSPVGGAPPNAEPERPTQASELEDP